MAWGTDYRAGSAGLTEARDFGVMAREVNVRGGVCEATCYIRLLVLAGADRGKAPVMLGGNFVVEERMTMGHCPDGIGPVRRRLNDHLSY